MSSSYPQCVQHVLTCLDTARYATTQLAESGLFVVGSQIGERNPVLWISPPATGCLDGFSKVTRYRGYGRMPERLMAAYVHGAQVQWVTR